jgi:tRNA (guanine37-N1)-methyltransferase
MTIIQLASTPAGTLVCFLQLPSTPKIYPLTPAAHLNLKEKYRPYKAIVAEVLLDKNPCITTVINKIDTIGESEYRTFAYEVLAGPPDLAVEVRQAGCVFEFDYSQVYWNSKLDTEHKRIVDLFRPGEVVCDVMAGIGPFAVPAGKKGVFVWANDKNPESFKYLELAIKRNKVHSSVISTETVGD